MRALAALLVAVALSSVASPALAQTQADRAKARKLAYDGQDALDRKDYPTAIDRFTQADAIVHAPTLLFGVAQGYLGLGKLKDARAALERIVRDGVPPKSPPAFAKAVEEAKAALADLDRRMPAIEIRVIGPTTYVVTVDGANVDVDKPIQVDPGDHVVRASADGFVSAEKHVMAAEGAPANVTFDLAPPVVAPPPPPPGGAWRRPLGFAVGGTGVAVLGLGVVTGILAIGKHGDLAKECPGGQCSSTSANSDLSGYHTMGTLSTVGFVAGGVLVAGGVTLVLTAPKRPATTDEAPAALDVRARIGAGHFELDGRF
ncbi:MAG TPA: hypothetical protein VGM56_26030 [Byssovorax sp.]|jgi:hypothetical protein